MGCNEEVAYSPLAYDINERHYFRALALALFFYGLLLAFLFIKIEPQGKKTIPDGNDLVDNLPRRTTPARVISVPRPKIPKSEPKPMPQTPQIPLAEERHTTSSRISKPTQNVESSDVIPIEHEITTGPIPLPTNTERQGGAVPFENISQESAIQQIQKTPRRGRFAWIKHDDKQQEIRHSTKIQDQTNFTENHRSDIFSQLESINNTCSTGFSSDNGDARGTQTYGSPQGTQDRISAQVVSHNTELELFNTRLIHNLCDASRQQPFYATRMRIEAHNTKIIVTIGRHRKVVTIRFVSPSPHQPLNDYLEHLLYEMLAPQLPESYQKDTISIPIGIHMAQMHGSHEIWLTPIK